MRKTAIRNLLPFLVLSLIVLLSACVKDRVTDAGKVPVTPIDPGERELIHYWDFNGSALLNPKFTIGGAAINLSDVYDNVEGTALNARQNSDAANGLRVRNPSTQMILKVPTTGYKTPLLTFAVMRTSNGAKENIIEYTTDGVNFTNLGLTANVVDLDTVWSVFSIDFSAIDAVNNNPDFAIRFKFNIGNTNASGNNRYDNITIDAAPLGGTNPNPEPEPGTDSLIHYWNFNGTDLLAPTHSIGNAGLSYTATFDPVNEGTSLNARNQDVAGNALRLRNPASDLLIKIPTNGFKEIKVKYVVMRTGNGAQTNNIFYTLDGTNYINTGLSNNSYPVTEAFVLQELDFSSIAGANNNANFGLKIEFADGNTNSSGNNRYDNLTVEAVRQ